MRIDIKENNIRRHTTFWITCCMCAESIEHTTPMMVIEEAKKKGWKFDTERDAFFCGQCVKKFLES